VQINYSTVFDVGQRKSYEKELLIAKRAAEAQNELINEINEKLLASEKELKSNIAEAKILNENLNKLVEYTFKNASIPIYFVLEDASIYNFNNIAAENLGYTSEELLTLKIYQVQEHYDEKKWASLWTKLKVKKKITIETQQKKKDGTLIDVLITANYFKYGDLELNCSYVLDITEKKKQEKELKLVDFTFNNSAIPIFLIKEDSSIYNINEAAAKGLGYSQEELKAKKIIEIDDNFDKEKWALHWADVKAKGSITIETTHTKKGGTISDLIININYLKHGDLELLCSYAIDITEKKKLEQQLNLLDYSYKNTNSAMFFLDVDGLYIDYNQATANLLGYSYEEFRGTTVMDVNPLMTKESWAKRWEELKDVPNQNFDVKLKRKVGTFIDVAVTTNSIELNEKIVNFGFYEDITEKKKLEDNLKLSAFTIDNAAWGLAYIKADGTIHNCNLAFAKMYGNTSLEEMKTKTAFDFGSAYTADSWKQYWEELKQKKSLHYIVKRTKKDGTIIDMEINANMIQFGDLELNCVYINDVTNKLKSEDDLKQSNQRYEYAILATSDVIWEADLQKNETFISKNFTTFFGHHVGNGWMPMENDFWMQNINPDDFDIVMKERYAVLNSKASNNRWVGEYRLKKADGSYATVKDKTFAIKDEDGKIVRMVGALQDITKQREEEERLRLMESVILNTTDSVIVTEANLIIKPDHPIVFVNDAFCKVTGYSKEEVIGKDSRMLQTEETDKNELDKFREKLLKWEKAEMTIINQKKNGDKFWANIVARPLADESGRFTHWIGVQRDVTKEIEATIEREKLLKELLENNLNLKQFTYITSHNLRAPLTNLVSICDIIQPETGTDEFTMQLIEGFKTSTYHLNETLNDLIEVLIIKENRSIQKDALTFEEIFKKITDSLSISLLEKKVIINADFSAAPSVIFANEYLESIFLNLVTNSVKYRHPDRNPIITIKTSRKPNGDTMLTFADNGVGINMDFAKDKIFGLYKRFHNNEDSKGIGLYLIHSQITTLGGKIEVESEVNNGTTFTITFK
jgi:PAS domain S-box-containing protein